MKYTKRVTKMGDKVTFPKKGDEVSCFYSGRLENGKVFDSNTEEGLLRTVVYLLLIFTEPVLFRNYVSCSIKKKLAIK